MFKRKPEIKNLAPLRSSDRRKLADQIIRDYQIATPEPSADDATSTAQPTLATVRNSLLPDSTASARFTTLSGPQQSLVSGTVYVGAHPGQDERILWFQLGKNPNLIPTVYTLWQNPGIVPLLHTPDFVVDEKLRHGSDLMVPGLVKAPTAKWDPRAKTGSVVAVAGMRKDTVPLWVGSCQIDVCNLGDSVQGQKGVAVKPFHWAGDECWSWKPLGSGGDEPPESVQGWAGLTARQTADEGHESLKDEADNGEEANDLAPSLDAMDLNQQAADGAEDAAVANEEEEVEEPLREPTTKEIDDAFFKAFLYGVHKAKSEKPGPQFGIDFPVQPSFFMSNMIQPYLRYQNQDQYTIKKTSWKNVKKFIKHLDKSGLAKSKDRNGGETVILSINFDDDKIVQFRPYRLPKPKAPGAGASNEAENAGGNASSSSDVPGQKVSVQFVYRVHPRLVPTLLPSKTDYYSAAQISSALKSYIESNPELGGQGASSIKLDPFLANSILGSNPKFDDSKILAAGRISRGALQKRLLDDAFLCQPYHIMVHGQGASGQKPKAGPPPRIVVTIEKRTGTKVVTKVTNLEPFQIDPNVLAPELQKKCAGSASVGQASGAKPGQMEIVVQGDQRKILVEDILPKRGIDPRWVDVVDKIKSKKK